MDENQELNSTDFKTADEISEELFKAIDAIIAKRLSSLKFDRIVLGTVKNSTAAKQGKYIVTTDSNITFDAYSDRTDLFDGLQVYIRIPQGDYTKRKVITELYEPIEVQQNNNYKLQNIIENEVKKFTIYYMNKELSAKSSLLSKQITGQEYEQIHKEIQTTYNLNKQRVFEQYNIIMPNFNDIIDQPYSTYWN